jgi:hypothetical protein
MNDNARGIGEPHPRLVDALAASDDPRSVVLDLPAVVDGRVAFTVVARDLSDGTQAWDVDLDWDGSSDHTLFWFDISGMEGISPGSSAPISGWATWADRVNLSIAFSDPELGAHGVAWVTGGAPREGVPAEEWEPSDWAELSRRIIDAAIGALSEEGDTHLWFVEGESR